MFFFDITFIRIIFQNKIGIFFRPNKLYAMSHMIMFKSKIKLTQRTTIQFHANKMNIKWDHDNLAPLTLDENAYA